MSTPNVLAPPPQMDGSPVTAVQPTTKEKVLGGIGGVLAGGAGMDFSQTPLAKSLAAHQQQRLAQAQYHQKAAATYAGALSHGEIDPQTGEPSGTNPDTGEPMTPEQRAQYKAMMQEAITTYQKAAGVDKNTKASAQKHGQLLNLAATKGHKAFDAVVQALKMGQGQPPGAQGGQGGGIAPPPAGPSQSAQPPMSEQTPAGGSSTAPPGTSAAGMTKPPAYGIEQQLDAPRLASAQAAQDADAHNLSALKQKDQAEFDQRSKHADALHLSGTDKDEYVATGKFPTIRSTSDKMYVDPETGDPFLGTTDTDGRIRNVDTQQIVPHALGTTAGASTPKPFNYMGADGQPHRGFTVGMQAYSMGGKPMNMDPEVFSAWMQPRTTITQGFKEVQQPDGSTKLVPVETSSTQTRGSSALAPPPSRSTAAPASAPSTKTPSGPPASASPKSSGGGGAKVTGAGTTVGGKVPTEVKKAYDSYNGSQERYAVMQDAVKRAQKGDQQAMVNLLANHIGMTMGLQKGSRITQAIYNEAMESAPWLQRVEARFDKNGYLSGVVLTPQQMTQMMDLAKVRLDQDKKSWQREVEANRTGYGTMSPPPSSDAVQALIDKHAPH